MLRLYIYIKKNTSIFLKKPIQKWNKNLGIIEQLKTTSAKYNLGHHKKKLKKKMPLNFLRKKRKTKECKI